MQAKRDLRLLTVLVVLLTIAVVFTSTAQDVGVTIHALLVIDGAAVNFNQHESAKDAMERLLLRVQNRIECNFQISILNTREDAEVDPPELLASSDNVLKWINDLRMNNEVNSDDVVWVYYSGHGSVRGDDFHISLSDGYLDRNLVVRKLEALPARLKILMTDACSYNGEPVVYLNPPSNLEAYRHLFYEHKGFLNVVSATKGELAGGSSEGGWFTRGFMAIMDQPGKADLDGNKFVSWGEILKETHRVINEIFDREYERLSQDWKDRITAIGQKGQNPIHFGELPTRIYREYPGSD